MDMAMALGLAGIALFGSIGAFAAAQPTVQPGVWPERAGKSLPYRTLEAKEIEGVLSREGFMRAVIESAVRQYEKGPGTYTRNTLKAVLEKDIARSAGKILLPDEIRELAGTSGHAISEGWKRAANKG